MDFNIFLRRYKFLLFRLKRRCRAERNPRDEVSWDSDGITTLPNSCTDSPQDVNYSSVCRQ
jgi:hypothetical protein